MGMFEEEYRNRINKVVGYIEQNLDSKLTLQLLSEQAGISQFHLHRLFLIYTGEPISGFIRRTRLATGFSEVQGKPGSSTVQDTAILVGYDSVSAFVRAFRMRFGFTPKSGSISRSKSLLLWRTQRSDSDKVVNEPVRMEVRPPQIIVGVMELGYHGRSFQKAAERAYSRVLGRVSEHNLHQNIGRACATMFDDPDLCNPNEVRYFGGFEWLVPRPPDGVGLENITLSSGAYAVFVHRGSYRNLWQTWNSAYRNWLPNSNCSLGDSIPFEIYINDPRIVKKEKDLITEIFLPIEGRLL
jgi:AraC family transcriptional regulator